MGSIRAVCEALKTRIDLEVARPENDDGSGGTSFGVDVLFGQENRARHQSDRGRVILSLADGGQADAPKQLNGSLRSLYTWRQPLVADLWAPVGQAGDREWLDRADAIEALVKCVLRAIYETFHGANVQNLGIALTAEIKIAPQQLRHGEGAAIAFEVGIPVTKGRTLQTLPAGASLSLNLRVNPES